MTTFHAADSKGLDLRRGVKLACAAYRSRTKREPPPIVQAHFESSDGIVLAEYTAAQIVEASK
jgi:hypothetical protein